MKTPSNIRSRITPGEARYAVNRLIETRRIKEREVLAIVADMHREIVDIERKLAVYYEATGRHPKGSRRAGLPALRPRSRRQASPQLAESRRLQGEYMGLIRHLSGAARAKIRKLAAEKGRRAAIDAMQASARDSEPA